MPIWVEKQTMGWDSLHSNPSTTTTLDTPEEDTEKNLQSASVATALARYDFPVPGGPYRRMPFHGLRLPVKICCDDQDPVTNTRPPMTA